MSGKKEKKHTSEMSSGMLFDDWVFPKLFLYLWRTNLNDAPDSTNGPYRGWDVAQQALTELLASGHWLQGRIVDMGDDYCEEDRYEWIHNGKSGGHHGNTQNSENT